MKGDRIFNLSDRQETARQNTKAVAKGGTEWSWVWIIEYPKVLMIVGVKYANAKMSS